MARMPTSPSAVDVPRFRQIVLPAAHREGRNPTLLGSKPLPTSPVEKSALLQARNTSVRARAGSAASHPSITSSCDGELLVTPVPHHIIIGNLYRVLGLHVNAYFWIRRRAPQARARRSRRRSARPTHASPSAWISQARHDRPALFHSHAAFWLGRPEADFAHGVLNLNRSAQ